jgi:hypothetical protein
MDESDAPHVEVVQGDARGLLIQATSDLSSIAATVDRVGEMFDPAMELLEASRSLHNALVFLSDWSGGGVHDKGVG